MADSMSKLIKRIRNYTYKKEDLVAPANAIQHTGESLVLNGEPIRATHTAVRHLCIHAKIPADSTRNHGIGCDLARHTQAILDAKSPSNTEKCTPLCTTRILHRFSDQDQHA